MKNLQRDFHFFTLDISTHSDRIYKWIEDYYQSLNQATLLPHWTGRYSLSIEELGSPFAFTIEPPAGAQFAKFCLLNAHCYYSNGVFFSEQTTDSVHQCEVDTVARTVKLNLGGLFIESEECFIYNVLRDLLKKLLFPLNHLLTLHGAIVTKNGQAIFLAGDKGMGKSTVALKLMEHDYAVLSDDSPLFTFFDGGTYALSSLDELSVTENTVRLFPKLAPLVSRQRDISQKFFLSRNLMPQEKLSNGPARITTYIDLVRGEHAQAKITRSPRTAVTGNLLREAMLLYQNLEHPQAKFFDQINQFQFDTISQVVSKADTYTLTYGNQHLAELPSLIESVL